MTSLLGAPIEHTADAPEANHLGVVATGPGLPGRSHAELCAELRGLPEVAELVLGRRASGPQALDIARHIDGKPLGEIIHTCSLCNWDIGSHVLLVVGDSLEKHHKEE